MNPRTLALILALTLFGAGLAALPAAVADEHKSSGRSDDRSDQGRGNKPAHAGGEDAKPSSERREARGAYHEEMQDARERFHDAARKSGQAHRDCAEQYAGNNTTGNETTLKDCHHATRDSLKDLRADARTQFQDAKKRAQEKYRDSLRDVRADYLTAHADGKGCEASERCVEHKIATLEAKKERAETMKAFFEQKIVAFTAATENSTGNESAGMAHGIRGLEVRLERIDAFIARVDAKLAHWNGILLRGDFSDEDASDGNETGNTTTGTGNETGNTTTGTSNETGNTTTGTSNETGDTTTGDGGSLDGGDGADATGGDSSTTDGTDGSDGTNATSDTESTGTGNQTAS